MPISEKLSFMILAEFMILYCKDNLGCIDNNHIELINNVPFYTPDRMFRNIWTCDNVCQ
jgi:hypothetical protein